MRFPRIQLSLIRRKAAGYTNFGVIFAVGVVAVLLVGIYALMVDSPAQEPSAQPLSFKEQEKLQKQLTEMVQSGRPVANIFEARVAPPTRLSFWQKHHSLILFTSLCGLLVVLTKVTLGREKLLAEVRSLTGKYLADGPEMAAVQIPSLFNRPRPTVGDDRREAAKSPESSTEGLRKMLAEFFSSAPEHLAEIRLALYDLEHDPDKSRRRIALAKIHGLVLSLKTKSEHWDLRPMWQMSSALEMLVQHLARKNEDATPSALRTISQAVEVLMELCVPGVRPDLIIHPPLAVLAVDDDLFCRRAVTFALKKASIVPDIAEDGETAVGLAARKHYDVIFMDIQMPGIDGLMACEQIHKGKKNHTTPVVFVTVQSDFQTCAQSTLKGGTELMAKPFLMLEITVKALTIAMRKRLADGTEAETQAEESALAA